MKERGLMGILFCKIHSPFICFCKPSAPPCCLYSQPQLKLGSTPRVPSSTVVDADGTVEFTGEAGEVNPPQRIKQAAINCCRRSCIRKSGMPKQIEKKKKSVQWVDNLGQELAEIKEFESSEAGDTDNEEAGRRCFCIIL